MPENMPESIVLPENSAPVLIAGAGPTGLMLAIELALNGLRPLVVEPLESPSTEPRANGLVGQVLRMLDRRGLYAPLAGSDEPPKPAPRYMFGAFPLDLSGLENNPVHLLMVPQRRIEQVLAERAAELGVEVRRGHRLSGFTQDQDGVTVEVDGPSGAYLARAGYLVGADGGRSVTRKLAGIAFAGVTTDRMVSRVGHVIVPDQVKGPATGGLNVPGHGFITPFMYHRTERGVLITAPTPTGATMISTIEAGDPDAPLTGPLTVEELQASVGRVLGVDIALALPEGPGMMRRLVGGNTRIADAFRAGRVLLLGDAAHVHSPIGGPGLNLGLQDAINLGWKLAAQVQGRAPEGLLDTYQSERRPAAERVTMHTQAQSVLISPGPEITALRTLFGELLAQPQSMQHLADLLAGADLRYDMGSSGGSDLTGRWAPDLTLEVGRGRAVRLAELTRTGRPLLVDLTAGQRLSAAAKPWADRVDIIAAAAAGLADPADPGEATVLLLRPDCYLAWASSDPDPDPQELCSALERWFGVAG